MPASFAHMELEDIATRDFLCACGQRHQTGIRAIRIGSGVTEQLIDVLAGQQTAAGEPLDKAKHTLLLVEDAHTRAAAGDRVEALLRENGWQVECCCFDKEELVADIREVEYVESLLREDMALLIAVGSGTLNDITKYAAFRKGLPFYIVGTAPSMDGYASPVAPMIVGGVKYALDAKGPEAIIGDIDVIRLAPERLMAAGYGDVGGKCVSICDWKVASLVTGEVFCEAVANTVLEAVDRCTANLPGLLRREPEAVQAVMEALVLCGLMMNYVKSSRPASGSEHNFGHIVEMSQLFAKEPVSLHGEGVAVGSVLSCVLYKRLMTLTPTTAHTHAMLAAWDEEAWVAEMKRLCPIGWEDVLAIEEKNRKNKADAILPRLEKTLAVWPELLAAAEKYIPAPDRLAAQFAASGAPVEPQQLGLDKARFRDCVLYARDMRYRYSILQLLHDLGADQDFADAAAAYFYG